MEKQKLLYQQARLHNRGAAEMVLQTISASKGRIPQRFTSMHWLDLSLTVNKLVNRFRIILKKSFNLLLEWVQGLMTNEDIVLSQCLCALRLWLLWQAQWCHLTPIQKRCTLLHYVYFKCLCHKLTEVQCSYKFTFTKLIGLMFYYVFLEKI